MEEKLKIEYTIISRGTEKYGSKGYMGISEVKKGKRYFVLSKHYEKEVQTLKDSFEFDDFYSIENITLSRFEIIPKISLDNKKDFINERIIICGLGNVGFASLIYLLDLGYKEIDVLINNNEKYVNNAIMQLNQIYKANINVVTTLSTYNTYIEATGKSNIIKEIIENITENSSIFLLGTPREGTYLIDPLEIHRKNINIFGGHELNGHSWQNRNSCFIDLLKKNRDKELVAIFSRRDIQTAVPLIKIEDMEQYRKKIDVVIMCGGSAKDLPNQVPQFAKIYNTVDSFDTHKNIPEYIEKINRINRESNTISLISAGWDPGLFSINRLYSEAIIPNAHTYTFWGKGVSQGHSDAIRKINGVKNAIQYTIPIDSEIEKARRGEILCLTNEQKHLRECFVVPEEGADLEDIKQEIINMKNYFEGYKVIIHFITEQELKEKHNQMPHGGSVICSGFTSTENKQIVEYSLKLDSNPEFTAGVLVAYARAVYKLSLIKDYGAKTVLDIPPVLLSSKNRDELIEKIL